MSNFIPIVFAFKLFWDSPDKLATLFALNPLEAAGLVALLGAFAAIAVKVVKWLMKRWF